MVDRSETLVSHTDPERQRRGCCSRSEPAYLESLQLERQLAAEGYRLRLYVPYGDAWYPYFMRRLAERPANVLFLLKNFFRG